MFLQVKSRKRYYGKENRVGFKCNSLKDDRTLSISYALLLLCSMSEHCKVRGQDDFLIVVDVFSDGVIIIKLIHFTLRVCSDSFSNLFVLSLLLCREYFRSQTSLWIIFYFTSLWIAPGHPLMSINRTADIYMFSSLPPPRPSPRWNNFKDKQHYNMVSLKSRSSWQYQRLSHRHFSLFTLTSYLSAYFSMTKYQ